MVYLISELCIMTGITHELRTIYSYKIQGDAKITGQ